MINKVTLVGRLGAEPEVRTLESGAMVAKFGMATSESYKDKAVNGRSRPSGTT
jgi:single-strand DNA-binding protein